MKHFIVNSRVPKKQLNELTCVIGKTDAFERIGVKDVRLKTCYCCSPQLTDHVEKALIEFEAESEEALATALQKLQFPYDSITEVTKMNVKKS